VDSRGRVAGINTAVIQPAQGICFAIPVNMAKDILPSLLRHGRVIRGYLGLHGRQVPIPLDVGRRVGIEMGHGVEVLALEPEGPADRAGLEIEDVIVSFGDESVASVDDLHKYLTQHPVGGPVRVSVLREGRRVELTVTPGEYPAPERG
jgi:S1-C subfamily serine protease